MAIQMLQDVNQHVFMLY